MISLYIVILSILFFYACCDLKILPINVKKGYNVMDSNTILKGISIPRTLNEIKNYKKIRKFKCIEVIEFVDEETGEVVDEEIIRKVKPKILITKKNDNVNTYIENIVKNKTFFTTTNNTSLTSTEKSQIKIFNKNHLKHLSNGYVTSKDYTILNKLIEKKYSDVYNTDKIESKKIFYKNNDYNKKKFLNYEESNDKKIFKPNNNLKTDEKNKKTENLNNIITPVVSYFQNNNDSSPIVSKNIDKRNNTIIEDKTLTEKEYNIPESPPYIPHRPEQKFYFGKYQKSKKNNFEENLNIYPYERSNYKTITEDEVIEKNILFTTPKPIIRSSNAFMNQAPLVTPKHYNTNILKNKTNIEEKLLKDNLKMTKENCQKMNYFSKSFGIKDIQKWIRNNCFFAQFYLPQATCQDIYTFVDSCFKNFFL
uniref:Ground-like domain-containing protein n=1 Tax=Strongyloides stercoralis TaxID=6248 RepID=A0A0K0ESA2_STRER